MAACCRRKRRHDNGGTGEEEEEEEDGVYYNKKLASKFECVICYQMPSNSSYSCQLCGEFYCQLCTATLGKRSIGFPSCAVCRDGLIYRCKFAEKLRDHTFAKRKVKCGGCEKRGYLAVIAAHQAYCDQRLVLCPDVNCKKPAMSLAKFYENHVNMRVQLCRVKKVGPWRANDNSIEFKFNHSSIKLNMLLRSPDLYDFTTTKIFLLADSMVNCGFYLNILRQDKEWHFNFHSYLTEEEARKYRIELTLYNRKRPYYISLWENEYTRQLDLLPYGKYMDPIPPYYTIFCQPLPQYTKFHPSLSAKHPVAERYVLRPKNPNYLTRLTDSHIRKVVEHGGPAYSAPKEGDLIPDDNVPPIKLNMFVKITKISK